jgi:FMN phosphatase YigB (HAD superfamily)
MKQEAPSFSDIKAVTFDVGNTLISMTEVRLISRAAHE